MLKDLEKVPIFCIYWYAPWGYDAINYNFAAALSNVVALFVIAFTTLKYSGVSSTICSRIFGGPMNIQTAQQLSSSTVEKPLAAALGSLKDSSPKS
jgi:type IV secretion system protein VirB6